MQNFVFHMPTEVVFGKNTELEAGRLVRQYGGTRVLLHYGGGSARRSGLLDRIAASLKEAGIVSVELGGVVPNPRLSKVREGIELCRREGVDFLLAVGGGSVIDSCKAIGYGLCYDGDVWDFYDRKAVPTATVPVGCVLTIAAAGSEMSDSSVITNEDGWKKRGLTNDICRARFAIMNPELTYTLPAWQTAAGCTDVLAHTLERYFSGPETVEPTDSMAEGLMRSMMEMAKRALQDPEDYEARAAIMWASSLSHNGMTGFGRGGPGRVGDWATHQIEHELSGMFDVTHGAGLAALWGSWARYVLPDAPARFARWARNVMGVDCAEDTEAALEGIRRYEAFLHSIGMPTSLAELGITLTEEQIRELSWKCTYEGARTVGSLRVLGAEQIAEVYRLAK